MFIKMKIKIIGLLLPVFLVSAMEEVCFFFSPDKKMVIEGKVEGVEKAQKFCRSFHFVVLNVKDEAGRVFKIYTSPFWFFTQRPEIGEKVKIKGAYWEKNRSFIIAEWIYFRGEKIYLRDERGFPLWSRRRRGGRLARRRSGKPWGKEQ